jgi:hypothetical protein
MTDRPIIIFGGTRRVAVDAARDMGLDPAKHAWPLSEAGRVLRGRDACDIRVVSPWLGEQRMVQQALAEIAAHEAKWRGVG